MKCCNMGNTLEGASRVVTLAKFESLSHLQIILEKF